MRLFTRTVHLSGPVADVIGQSTEMRALVTAKTGVEVGLWNVQFGAPLGTVVYSAHVEGLGQLMSMNDTLMADAEYHELLARGAGFVDGPVEDSLGVPLHGDLGEVPPVGTVVMATRAVVAGGKYAEAAAWGIDMAIHSEKVTGFPVGFFMDSFGTFGSVAWLSGAPDAAAAESAGDTLNADPSYLEKLGEVGDLFVPLSGVRSMATRIA